MRQSGFVQSDGLQIYFEQYGAGAHLVLVHGWGADSRANWLDTGWIDTLKAHRTITAIDIRGHGKSDKPHALAPYSYANMSNDVLAVLTALNIQHTDFMGYSMGAFMGAYLLGHHAALFNAMVLGGIGNETQTSAAAGTAIAQALRAPGISNVDNPVDKAVRKFVEADANNDLAALAFSAEKMWPEGYPLKLAGTNIKAAKLPVLIVNGENDHPYVDSADLFADALPNGEHLTIPGTDHLSTVPDNRFKQAVVDFLQRDV